MSFSSYPNGMGRADLDHVEGVVRCEDCGADITRLVEDYGQDVTCCPDGCEDPQVFDRREDLELERGSW